MLTKAQISCVVVFAAHCSILINNCITIEVFGQIGPSKQCRSRSGSTLFAILSASFQEISMPTCLEFYGDYQSKS